MGKLFDEIRAAVREDRWLVSWHADERCEERGAAIWQVVAEIEHAELVEERPHAKPNPSVRVREILASGREIEAVWSWLAESRRAKLVTVYYRD
jgi:hypothetical protein